MLLHPRLIQLLVESIYILPFIDWLNSLSKEGKEASNNNDRYDSRVFSYDALKKIRLRADAMKLVLTAAMGGGRSISTANHHKVCIHHTSSFLFRSVGAVHYCVLCR